jgi:gliding motility-associated-like protein
MQKSLQLKKVTVHIKKISIHFRFMFTFAVAIAINYKSLAQCPPNIDFEKGNFNGWQCWAGSVDTITGQNQITLAPTAGPLVNRQVILSLSPGDGIDKYGKFPRNCPNGSGHSIQLGNEQNGHMAEGLSYQFSIPANANRFKLIVNYAIVLQDPEHLPIQQPRFKMEAFNITDNIIIACSSNDFFAQNGVLDFKPSGILSGGIPVYYKDWSGISMSLDGNAGKTIRLFFKTAGCTYIDHFCYAYIDVNTECDGSLANNSFCINDTVVKLKAPVGFQDYTWYDNTFSQLLGNGQSLILKPAPANGTIINVVVNPGNSYGCKDTLVTQLTGNLTVNAKAGPDTSICNLIPVQLGGNALPGLVYKWEPARDLDNPNISNPMAKPFALTQYVLTVKSEGGGCATTDTINVGAKIFDRTFELIGDSIFCLGNGALPILRVKPADIIKWFKDSTLFLGTNQTEYTVNQTGKYFVELSSSQCPLPVSTKNMYIQIDAPAKPIRYPDEDAAFNFPEPLQARPIGNSATWTPAINLSNRFSYNPTFTGAIPQEYTILLKTASGCVTVDTQYVKTNKKIKIYVPTAFTPDGNGTNERLRPGLIGFSKVNYFRVYNRWGKLLFSMNSDQPGWDGKIDNAPAGIQTVVWMIEAVDVDGKVHNQQGTTVLFR